MYSNLESFPQAPLIRCVSGLSDYQSIWDEMRLFTEHRTDATRDEIWVIEHEPVYTLGQAGKPEHLLNTGKIPVVRSNRGGQVTYHGPGQVVLYPLLNLRRYQLYVREYVQLLEETVLEVLRSYGLPNATRKEGAPGVYVPYGEMNSLAKIAALGVKVSQGCTYHGLALNVKMDLTPFDGINPCGYAGLKTIDLFTLGIEKEISEVAKDLLKVMIGLLQARFKP